jgi:chloramphenicol 3-O phosphotransferase
MSKSEDEYHKVIYASRLSMSKMILLNGASSSGKTSIARSIQSLSNEQWLTFGVDTFIDMMPYPSSGKDGAYFDFVPGENERGPLMSVVSKPAGDKLFGAMTDFAHMLGCRGNNLIIDEVLLNDKQLKSYVDKLADHTVYFVGVKCDLAIMQEREYLRRDRALGLSNDQFDRVHTGAREYDFMVDTSNTSVFDAAKAIITFIDNNPNPKGFHHMRGKL